MGSSDKTREKQTWALLIWSNCSPVSKTDIIYSKHRWRKRGHRKRDHLWCSDLRTYTLLGVSLEHKAVPQGVSCCLALPGDTSLRMTSISKAEPQCSVTVAETGGMFSLLGRQKLSKNGLTQQSPQVLSQISKGPDCSCGLCFQLMHVYWWFQTQVEIGTDPRFFKLGIYK